MSVSICVTGRNTAKLPDRRVTLGDIFYDRDNVMFLRLSGGVLMLEGELAPMIYSGRDLRSARFTDCTVVEGKATIKINLGGK